MISNTDTVPLSLTYTLTATGDSCVIIDSVRIILNPNLIGNINSDTIFAGDSAMLVLSTSIGGGTITWSTNDTTESISVSPDSTTTYTATYTLNGCSFVFTSTVVVQDTVTGLTENNRNRMRIYPNPSSEMVNIELDRNTADNVSISIVNCTGQQVMSATAQGNTLSLDISRLSKGIYFVFATSKEGVIAKKKLAIN